jgi:hypothetical protein
MTRLIALDVAVLPPPDITARAMALSAALPVDEPPGLRLDEEHLPHITLTQQFVREDELDVAFEHVEGVLRDTAPFQVRAAGCAKDGHNISIAIERTPDLIALHERLMEALRGLERQGGTPAAFADHDARVADMLWVSGFHLKSSFGAYSPHITLGHGEEPPALEPFVFDARDIAACHLGRYCTCRTVLRRWSLTGKH